MFAACQARLSPTFLTAEFHVGEENKLSFDTSHLEERHTGLTFQNISTSIKQIVFSECIICSVQKSVESLNSIHNNLKTNLGAMSDQRVAMKKYNDGKETVALEVWQKVRFVIKQIYFN